MNDPLVDFLKQFGERCRAIRLAKEMSLRDVAANCNLDDGNISKIEQGKRNVKLSTVYEIAKGLEVEPWELLK